ncbi:MAG: tyrosine-type recombinase/integrase [Methanocorpusculaceae archaeon]|nr:tyrosine-type recombinase/integrase [Methanocorpusculaceae archaeon]
MVRVTEIDRALAELDATNAGYIRAFVRKCRLKDLSELTTANYVSHIHGFLADLNFPDAAVLTAEQIEDWYLEKKREVLPSGKTVSPATLKGYVVSLSVFFQFLKGEEAGRQLVNIRVKVPFTNVKEEELVTRSDIRRMLDAATNERDRALVAVFYSSGARMGELCGLRLKDVHVSQFGASLRLKGKTGERVVDIFLGMPELQAWLNVHPLKHDTNAPLFVTLHPRGGGHVPLSPKTIQGFFKRLGDRAGIEDKKLNPHSFRHARATDAAGMLSVADMNHMFGWRPGSNMSQVYVHSSRERVSNLLAKQEGIQVPDAKPETALTVQCPRCRSVNPVGAVYCCRCSKILDEEFALLHANTLSKMDEKN